MPRKTRTHLTTGNWETNSPNSVERARLVWCRRGAHTLDTTRKQRRMEAPRRILHAMRQATPTGPELTATLAWTIAQFAKQS